MYHDLRLVRSGYVLPSTNSNCQKRCRKMAPMAHCNGSRCCKLQANSFRPFCTSQVCPDDDKPIGYTFPGVYQPNTTITSTDNQLCNAYLVGLALVCDHPKGTGRMWPDHCNVIAEEVTQLHTSCIITPHQGGVHEQKHGPAIEHTSCQFALPL